jgi:hypothetical protein
LSDDSPLVARDGLLKSFPLRIGLLPGSETGYRPEQLRTVQRMEFGPKLLVRYREFEERIVPEAAPSVIFIGRRSLADGCAIEPCSKLRALLALIPNCVIGLGLFQGMEFVFNRGAGEVLRKVVIAFSRLRNCMALVHRSRTAVLVLGRDSESNTAALLAMLRTGLRDSER